MTLIACYKARFQIEFVFRDAKQYTGLMDCQSRKQKIYGIQVSGVLLHG